MFIVCLLTAESESIY